MKTNHEGIFCDLVEGLRKKHGYFICEFDFGTVIAIVGQIQLALRHPDNTGHSAQQARKAIEEIIARLEAAAPGIGRYLNMGFDPAKDMPVAAAEKANSITK